MLLLQLKLVLDRLRLALLEATCPRSHQVCGGLEIGEESNAPFQGKDAHFWVIYWFCNGISFCSTELSIGFVLGTVAMSRRDRDAVTFLFEIRLRLQAFCRVRWLVPG